MGPSKSQLCLTKFMGERPIINYAKCGAAWWTGWRVEGRSPQKLLIMLIERKQVDLKGYPATKKKIDLKVSYIHLAVLIF